MRLESAQGLKQQLLNEVVEPLATPTATAAAVRARPSRMPIAVRRVAGDPSLFSVGARAIETVPEVQRSLALGVAPYGKQYRLAIRLQRAALRDSPIVEHLKKQAKGEVDIRMVGRIDKRAPRGQVAW